MGERAGTISKDSNGNPSQTVSFREGNIGTPISCTSTAQVVPASEWRNNLLLKNDGPRPAFFGFDNTVTSTDGFEIPVNGEKALAVGAGIDVWIVCAAAETATLRVAELG